MEYQAGNEARALSFSPSRIEARGYLPNELVV